MGDDETVTIETTEVDPENIEETVTVSSDLDGKQGEIWVVCYLNEGGLGGGRRCLGAKFKSPLKETENMMGPLLVHVYEVINMRELLER